MRLAPLALAATLIACSDAAPTSAQGTPPATGLPFKVAEVADFDSPWAMTFLPDGRMLVTEKAGQMLLVAADGQSRKTIGGIPAVDSEGQGGLMDVVLAPGFAQNRHVYFSFSETGAGGKGVALARGTMVDGDTPTLSDVCGDLPRDALMSRATAIIRAASPSRPDGQYLFFTNGERQKFDPAQDPKATLGKVLRLTLDGKPAAGNPLAKQGFHPAVWSYGHRNLLGIAFDAQGNLWEQEMGPKGGDEVNLVQVGKNYGYPKVSNGDHYDGRDIPDHKPGDGFEAPKVSWNPVISPGGLIVYSGAMFPEWQGDLFIGGLSSKALIRVDVTGTNAAKGDQWDLGTRIREVEQGPDGALWVLEDGQRGAGGRMMRLTRGKDLPQPQPALGDGLSRDQQEGQPGRGDRLGRIVLPRARIDVGDPVAQPPDRPRRARFQRAAAAHEIDRQVHGLDPYPIVGQRVAQRDDRRHFHQPAESPRRAGIRGDPPPRRRTASSVQATRRRRFRGPARATRHRGAASSCATPRGIESHRCDGPDHHEGARDVRDRIVGVAVMRDAAHEGDAARHAVTFAAPDHAAPRHRRAQIVDPEVQRRLRHEAAALHPHAHAGRHVHQRQDRPGGEHARGRIADLARVPRYLQFGPVRPVRAIADTDRMAVPGGTGGKHPFGIERDRCRFGHRPRAYRQAMRAATPATKCRAGQLDERRVRLRMRGMTDDRVSITITDGIADVRLTRPDKMNALDPAMFDGIVAAIDRLNGEDGVRCVVLSGEGAAFCAGLDMASMVGGSGIDLLARSHGIANKSQQVAWGWRALPMPVIAAVHGIAFGGGLQIMSGADAVFVHPATRMAVMEMKWGHRPRHGGLCPVARSRARRPAARAGLYRAEFSGADAVGYGFALEAVDDPLGKARDLAAAIAGRNPHAIRAAKRLVQPGHRHATSARSWSARATNRTG